MNSVASLLITESIFPDLQVAFDDAGDMKLATVEVEAPLHEDMGKGDPAPGSASDANLKKLLDRKLDDPNSRLLVTGRLAMDENGKVVPKSSDPAQDPTTVLVLGPLLDKGEESKPTKMGEGQTEKGMTEEGKMKEGTPLEGKTADKAKTEADLDAMMKPNIDPAFYDSLETGSIAFAGPRHLGKDKASPKPPEVTVDLTGKLVDADDLGLNKTKVKVKGAVVDDKGKVLLDDLGNLKMATLMVDADIHDFDDQTKDLKPGKADDIGIDKLQGKGGRDPDKTFVLVTGDPVDAKEPEEMKGPLRVVVLGPLLDKGDGQTVPSDTTPGNLVKGPMKDKKVSTKSHISITIYFQKNPKQTRSFI